MLPGLEQLIVDCAPQVAPSTMGAIVRVESGGRPYAINVNGEQALIRQPKNKEEAVAWADWLVKHGYSVDMGLAQINSGNLRRLGLTPAQLFEPCTNIKAGARILSDNYSGAAQRYGQGQTALHAALSAYNTGNYSAGIANGYVSRVVGAAGGDIADANIQPLPSAAPPLARSSKVRRMSYSYTASSGYGNNSYGGNGYGSDSYRANAYGGSASRVSYAKGPARPGYSASPTVVWVRR